MITAEFRAAQDSDSAVDFVVANLGQTPARDLTVTFEPPLEVPEDAGNLVSPFIVRRYENPISVLNPGQSLSNTWWRGMNTGELELVNREPTPDEVTVTMTYRGRGLRRLHDSYNLTIETVSLTTWSVSSSSPKGRLRSIDESLASIRSSLAALAKSAEKN